jgi:hypothetical protein
MHFDHSVLNPDIIVSVYIGGLEKHSFDRRLSAKPTVLTLEKAYSEQVPIKVK